MLLVPPSSHLGVVVWVPQAGQRPPGIQVPALWAGGVPVLVAREVWEVQCVFCV